MYKTRSILSLAFLLFFSTVNNSSNFVLASSYSFFFFADFLSLSLSTFICCSLINLIVSCSFNSKTSHSSNFRLVIAFCSGVFIKSLLTSPNVLPRFGPITPNAPNTIPPASLSSKLPPAVANPNAPNAPILSGILSTFDACIILPKTAPLPAAIPAAIKPSSDARRPSTIAIAKGTDLNTLVGNAYSASVIGVIAKPANTLPAKVSGVSKPKYSALVK